MGSKRRKLILSVLMLVMTFACLTSTTYAWFARNREAWTEDFQLDIENYDGLLISIDGKNFGASIDNKELKKAVVAKINNIDILADNESDNKVLTDDFINQE